MEMNWFEYGAITFVAIQTTINGWFLTRIMGLRDRIAETDERTAIIEARAINADIDRGEMKELMQAAVGGINDLTVTAAKMSVQMEAMEKRSEKR